MIVLGIDAGFTATGLCAIDLQHDRITASACIRTQKTSAKRAVRVADDDAERCTYLAREIAAFLHKTMPQVVVVELPSGGAQGARANRAMGMSTGIVSAVLALTGYPVEWVTPQAVKKAAAGRRDASKQAVEQSVRQRFQWPDGTMPKTAVERSHICDAAASVMAAEHGALLAAVRRMESASGGASE